MTDDDFLDIDSVVVPPEYCHRCGAELVTREWEGEEVTWCQECEVAFGRIPAPGAHVVVHDEENVLVLDEPIPQHEGLLSLPGGYAGYDETPREAALRELEEETGLHADPEDLRFLTILHATLAERGFYLITYDLERSNVSGELTPEAEGFEVEFKPLEELRASPDRIRESDLNRIEMAFED